MWVDAGWDDVLVVPLSAQGRSFCELHVYLPAGTEISGDEEAFLTALADQAAVAAQNADLFGAAQQNATLLERQRLARELHDSVSRALFSMTLQTPGCSTSRSQYARWTGTRSRYLRGMMMA